MFSILVVGHGLFAYGMEKTVELVMGAQEKMEFENYEGGMPLDIFEKNIEQKILQMGNDYGTLVLADIKGGTPFNTGVIVGNRLGKVEIIGGCNLPMIVESLDARESYTLQEAVDGIVESSKNEIAMFKKAVMKIEENDEEGL